MRMVNVVRVVKPALTTHPNDDNPDELLEVIYRHDLVREGVHVILFYLYYSLSEMGELARIPWSI